MTNMTQDQALVQLVAQEYVAQVSDLTEKLARSNLRALLLEQTLAELRESYQGLEQRNQELEQEAQEADPDLEEMQN